MDPNQTPHASSANGNGRHTIQVERSRPKTEFAIDAKQLIDGEYTTSELGVLIYILSTLALHRQEAITPQAIIAHFKKDHPAVVISAMKGLVDAEMLTDDGELDQLMQQYTQGFST